MSTIDNDYRHFTREDLLAWPPNGQRQAQAWDRLRAVCLDLGLHVPTLADIKQMDRDLGALYLDFQQRWNLFDEEWAGLVICARAESGEAAFVQFGAGYIFDREAEPAPGDDQASGNEAV